ncbi:MAG: phospholipid methyltransferase [Alphaproteobacteria bacterium]|nr:phospholipid methyltransferase [Alphaproteobacteria bacterium]
MPQHQHAKIKVAPSYDPKRASRQRPHHLLAAFFRSPLTVGAIVPSSRALTKVTAAHVDQSIEGAVVELGGGTGVVTSALLHAGIAPERVIVVERDPRLHAALCLHFPQLNIICGDAIELSTLLENAGVTKVATIISSLPHISLPKEVTLAIEEQMLKIAIANEAEIIRFTYGSSSPISVKMLHKFHMVGKRVKFVLANVPPAHVWVYRKK